MLQEVYYCKCGKMPSNFLVTIKLTKRTVGAFFKEVCLNPKCERHKRIEFTKKELERWLEYPLKQAKSKQGGKKKQ